MNQPNQTNPVLLTTLGKSAILRLNQPETYNSFTMDMIEAIQKTLNQLIQKISTTDEISCLVLTGSEKVFSGGGNLNSMKEFIDKGKPTGYLEWIVPHAHKLIKTISNFPLPTLAALNGVAVGGGLNLAFACDFRIASTNAKLRLGFTDIGLTPAAGGSFFPTRFLGISRAMQLSLSGGTITAQQALTWGLVAEIASHEKFENLLEKWSKKLSNLSPDLVRSVRELMHSGWFSSLETHLEKESEYIYNAGSKELYKQSVLNRINELNRKTSEKL
ncbi:MAG: enoyl-CoA hydratase/isomerase family protein [Candidatus Hodarchaeales archaeon]